VVGVARRLTREIRPIERGPDRLVVVCAAPIGVFCYVAGAGGAAGSACCGVLGLVAGSGAEVSF
jgi:hypothetical protein